MTPTRLRRHRLRTVAVGLLATTLVPGLAQIPALAESPTKASPSSPFTKLTGDPVSTLADSVPGLSNLDARTKVLPTLTQKSAADALGDVTLRWNSFGTPASILPADGVLARATSTDPVKAARAYLSSHAAVFGLTKAQVAKLKLVNNQKLVMGGGNAVLLRQEFGGASPALDSMVTVGVARGQIAYVSSSLTKATGTPAKAALTPLQGWVAAAKNVGKAALTTGDITSTVSGGWTRLTVPGLAQEQQVRLRSLAVNDQVRSVYEANVVDVQGGSAFAYTLMVDAASGKVLHRENQVENSSDTQQLSGSYPATGCGPMQPFETTDDKTRTITAVVGAAIPSEDIVVKLFGPTGNVLTSSDTATSPEVLTYTADSIAKGIYNIQVCSFDGATVPNVGGPYAGAVSTSDTAAPGTGTTSGDSVLKSRWRYFTGNPTLDTPQQTPSNSVIGCWIAGDGCTDPNGPLRNVQAPGPWDTLIGPDGPRSTFTTVGNNANTHEAWGSPLTPGGLGQAPYSPTQDYTTPFTDAWNNSKCDPAQLTPGGNDINASVTNLFVGHNKMHDYSYYLGFNERNYNLQANNVHGGGVAGDQEVGNAQAGAIDGGAPSYMGRDNANQITLQDGVPGITNQYLFQPIAGAFYAPCTDGGLDFGIFAHEYTHAITGRMVGGPDEGITSEQGGAMGESWSDLNAAQFMYSHGYGNGGNVFAVGVYATGNKDVAIRDYSINHNPLNYSDYGFDTTGPEVHADGEIWNGTQWSVRQALVKKYNAKFPTTNKELQLKCSDAGRNKGVVRPQKCPGDRRWIQLIFDSFLLQQGNTSMLDARDAMLAADMMRFGGDDLKVMWDAFARRGMGQGATTPTADSQNVHSTFASPKSKNAKVTFKTPGSNGKVYVGHYQARVTPAADTLNKSKLGSSTQLVAGKYEMLYTSPTTGFKRFTLNVKPGQRKTVTIKAPKNLAAKASGGKVINSTDGSRNAEALIDGTEATNWGGVTTANVDEANPFVAVDLAGAKHRINKVQVSAYLHPAPASGTAIPFVVDDPDSGSRFTALRKFAVEACTSGCSSSKAVWKRVFTSTSDAFPAVRPRPVAPNLTLRSYSVKPFTAQAVRLVALENQCTGFGGYAGELDNDPTNATDCKTASDRGTIVHAAEFQVFGK